MQLTNATASAKTPGNQAKQHLGTGSTQLSFDLHFDTADEGTDVRTRIEAVERFVLPSVPGSKQAPPRVLFHWGQLRFEGVMTSLQEEIDLFSSQGVPLRAKVAVTIAGQHREREKAKSDATGGGAVEPGAKSAPPGTAGGGPGDRTGAALGGESAAQFAARMGLDPNAWRGLGAGGLSSPLSLAAGMEIDFSAGLSASLGVGVQSGIAAGAGASIDQAFGLSSAGGAAGPVAAGFALAAAGGVRAAVETVQIAKAARAASQAREAFAEPTATTAAPAATRPAAPEQQRRPLGAVGLPAGPARAAPAAPVPPRADPRARSFGFGVPLRPRVSGAADERKGPFGGLIVVGTRPRREPGQPGSARGTIALPGGGCGCGCGGGCH
jgi:hypothetical protein